MNRLQLRNLCRYWLDDLAGGYFTNDQVNFWLNDAQKEVQKLLIQSNEDYFTKCVVTTMVANQGFYELPNDFLKIQRLEVVLSGTYPQQSVQVMKFITLGELDRLPNTVSTPIYFYFKKDRLILAPAPQVALPLRLWYTYLINDMTDDTDVPDIPTEYHEFIAILAANDGFLKDGRDPGPIIEKRAYYERRLEQDAESRYENQPRMIVRTDDDDYGLLI